MENNKFLVAFLLLVVVSAFYWMQQTEDLNQRYSVLRESFSQNDTTSGGIQVGLSETEASQCFYVDLSAVNRTLKRGTQGEDVKAVQTFLTNEYALTDSEITTGYFGALTEQWVKELQLDKSLRQTGVVDSKTLMAMEEEQVASCTQ